MSEAQSVTAEMTKELRAAVTRVLGELDLLFEVVKSPVQNVFKEWRLVFAQASGAVTVTLFVWPEYLFGFAYPFEGSAPALDATRLLQVNAALPLVKIAVDASEKIVVWGQVPSSCINAQAVRNLLNSVCQGVDAVRAFKGPMQSASATVPKHD